MRSFLRFLLFLSLGLWLGAIFFFSLAVAPNVFAILSPILSGRSLAADIVGRALTTLHYLGLACGVLYLIMATFLRAAGRWAVLLMLGATLLSQFAVTPYIHSLRAAGLTASRPFQMAHALSTWLEAIAFLAGVVALWQISRQKG